MLWSSATLGGVLGGTVAAALPTTPGRVSFTASATVWGGVLSGFTAGAVIWFATRSMMREVPAEPAAASPPVSLNPTLLPVSGGVMVGLGGSVR